MTRLKILLSTLLLTSAVFAQDNSGEIHGKLLDVDTKEPLSYMPVYVKNGNNKIGAQTNDEGKFVIKPLPVGTYVLYTMTLDGKEQALRSDIIVKPNSIAFAKDVLASPVYLDTLVVKPEEKIIDPEETSVITMDAKTIGESAAKRNPAALISTMNSGIKIDDDNNLYLRGARQNDMLIIMDGVKMRGLPSLPATAYESISAYLGGLPAKYGDTMGGAIIIESKSYFDYYRQWKAQQEIKN
ncbi:MAG: carboxypeptidase-like regulatory domain-containing protein [Bacteroidia bacterium]